MTDIIAAAATAHGVTVFQVLAGTYTRTPEIMAARKQAVLALHATGLSFKKIGVALNMTGGEAWYLSTERAALKRRAKHGSAKASRAAQEENEPISTARARVARELAAGNRCPTCHLTLPCSTDGSCSSPTAVSFARARRDNGGPEAIQ